MSVATSSGTAPSPGLTESVHPPPPAVNVPTSPSSSSSSLRSPVRSPPSSSPRKFRIVKFEFPRLNWAHPSRCVLDPNDALLWSGLESWQSLNDKGKVFAIQTSSSSSSSISILKYVDDLNEFSRVYLANELMAICCKQKVADMRLLPNMEKRLIVGGMDVLYEGELKKQTEKAIGGGAKDSEVKALQERLVEFKNSDSIHRSFHSIVTSSSSILFLMSKCPGKPLHEDRLLAVEDFHTIGVIFAFDMIIRNFDRFPNDLMNGTLHHGNAGNLLLGSTKGEVYCIDHQIGNDFDSLTLYEKYFSAISVLLNEIVFTKASLLKNTAMMKDNNFNRYIQLESKGGKESEYGMFSKRVDLGNEEGKEKKTKSISDSLKVRLTSEDFDEHGQKITSTSALHELVFPKQFSLESDDPAVVTNSLIFLPSVPIYVFTKRPPTGATSFKVDIQISYENVVSSVPPSDSFQGTEKKVRVEIASKVKTFVIPWNKKMSQQLQAEFKYPRERGSQPKGEGEDQAGAKWQGVSITVEEVPPARSPTDTSPPPSLPPPSYYHILYCPYPSLLRVSSFIQHNSMQVLNHYHSVEHLRQGFVEGIESLQMFSDHLDRVRFTEENVRKKFICTNENANEKDGVGWTAAEADEMSRKLAACFSPEFHKRFREIFKELEGVITSMRKEENTFANREFLYHSEMNPFQAMMEHATKKDRPHLARTATGGM